MKRLFASAVAVSCLLLTPSTADAACNLWACDEPQVGVGNGALTATYVDSSGSSWAASNAAPPEHPYTYRLRNPCAVSDEDIGACRPTDFQVCDAAPGRVVNYYVVERRRLVLGDGTTADGFIPPPGSSPGQQVGGWQETARRCVDVTALNPPPSPDEVFRYFRTLPLPQLPTRQQPPGDGLVGLPVIFFTDGPTTQTFTLDIRGFTVEIAARATGFTWHTGDGTALTTTGPGAPYPDHTISHDYASGTYTASLTTTWTATFRIDGGTTVPVPGSTTTDGEPVTFDVLQARPVLTNPFD
ncbi:hypothetical protein [Blastococcus sp. CCUG 61487]|uniref:hypothetical protein n=1 Tax=Blastococcus sp. CCUG 61487 TaxID=1840703 RepID=UPI0010C12023|nr:hypothetical protein [Blastococcus sp. CCUG 61487]TKJ35643.1 hypothetical protein A6V29_14120 [Blastococcus sp. CCUG 61487]